MVRSWSRGSPRTISPPTAPQPKPKTASCIPVRPKTRFSIVASLRRSVTDRGAVQIVGVGALDLHRRDFADPQRPVARDIDRAVDLRRVRLAAALCDARADLIDDDALAIADFTLEPARGNCLLLRHEAVPALFLDLGRHRRAEIVGRGAGDRLVAKAADSIELGLAEPFQQ